MSKAYNQLMLGLEQAKSNWKCDWKWKVKEFQYRLIEIFFYSWYSPINGLYKSIRRTIEWIPIVWNNYEWDHVFLLRVMQFKIQRMQKHHQKYQRHEGVDKTIDQLNRCQILLERLIKDEYVDELYKKHNDKYYSGMDMFERIECTLHDPKERREFKQLMDHEEYMKKQDMAYFCKLFSKYYRTWWD